MLRAMGHDDEIAIVDATYPAASAGSKILRSSGRVRDRGLGRRAVGHAFG